MRISVPGRADQRVGLRQDEIFGKRGRCSSWSGHKKIESTVRYLGIEVDDALAIAEQVDI
jgi:hypothetical protein